MKRTPARTSFESVALLALLLLVPVTFTRLTAECFEIPQSSVLVIGAALILWRRLAAGLWDLGRSGLGSGLGGMVSRAMSALRHDPLGASILLYLASALASTLVGPNPEQSVHGAPDSTSGLVVACATATVYFAARSVSQGQPVWLVRFARAAGAAALIAGGYALLQLAGLDPLVWQRTATFGADVRIFGTLGHPNMLGAYLLMTVPLTGWLTARARSVVERVIWGLVTAVSLVAIAATLSRGAWIGLMAAVVSWLLLGLKAKSRAPAGAGARAARHPRRMPVAVLGTIVVLLLAGFVFTRAPIGAHVGERLRQIATLKAPTTQSRLHIWRAGFRMFEDHRWLGVGLDSFGTVFPRYRSTDYWAIEWGRTPNKAHNEAIQILAAQGIFGGAAALLVVLFAAGAVWKATGRGEPPARAAAAAAGGTLVGFAVQDLASFTVVALGALAAAVAGWLSASAYPAASERRESDARGRRGETPRWALAIAAIPTVVILLYAVALPVRAQLFEKIAFSAPAGSLERAEALRSAASSAAWDSRYSNFLALSLYEQALHESSSARARDLLRRARTAGEHAIGIEPENGYYYSNQGRVGAIQARLRPPDATIPSVEADFNDALARDSVNAQIMDQASNALFELGRRGTARAYAQRSAALYPDLAQPMAYLGYAALYDRRFREAEDTLKLAVRRQWFGETVAEAATWSNLAAAYLAQNRNAEARDAADEALRLNPGNQDARANRELAVQRLSQENQP